MGATTFITTIRHHSAMLAFREACENARNAYGSSGYTGTIAEKSSFIMIHNPANEEPEAFARMLLNADDPRITDKYGPAGCLVLPPLPNDNSAGGRYLFFGWAAE
jgi:hypothetical protein